ncbi:unnamed protein product [Pleuronectes platessa]|uniref:Uncharacterized protein n=1 Tax=Pleuronectes platessa TaxID=8262 RepID=A0A9N7ULI6_PLEPL|nr:unnamed protein product [Pleuronectes platessa]
MNPADSERLRSEVVAQASALYQQERQLTAMAGAFQEASARNDQHLEALNDQFQRLLQVCQPPAVSLPAGPPARAPSSPEPHLSAPDRFSRAPGTCRSFLILCSAGPSCHQLNDSTASWRTAACTVGRGVFMCHLVR